jgi:cell shape-determining protein MreC
MLSWILQISIISIIFIFLVHHLLYFFKSTLTVPKTKDLVNSPAKKYQDIFDTISNTNSNYSKNRNNYLPSINANEYNNVDTDYTDINLLPTENTNSSSNDMKDELKSFLKKQLNSSDQDIGLGSVF